MAKRTLKLLFSWVIWTLAMLTYFQQYYLRETISSLVDYLMHDFFLTVVDLNNLVVLFFLAYVLMLPLAGILLDRYGVKKILPLASIVAAISCFLFSDAHTDMGLVLARILKGASASFSLLAILLIIRKNFRANLFPVLSGLTLTIGLLGGICGDWFLVDMSKIESWRVLTRYVGWFSVIVAVLLYISIHKQEVQDGEQQLNSQATLKNYLNGIRSFCMA